MDLRTVQAKGLKGLFHFPEGLAFDFSALPEGVIAIVGANGAGKSTLLELPIAAFYHAFPSRPEAKLLDAVDGRDAFLDVQIACEGRGVYRARVNVDGVARTAQALLECTRPDGTIVRVNDGKISTFKDAVAREFPSLTLLLASAFADQLRTGSFRTAGKKECRELFADLLGLALYEQRATTARAAALLVDKRLEGLRSLIAHLAPRTTEAELEAISARANRLHVDLAAAVNDVETCARVLAEREGAVADLRSAAARFIAADEQHRAHIQRRQDRARDVDACADQRRQLEQDLARERGQILGRRDGAIAAAEQAIGRLPTEAQLTATRTRRLAEIDARATAACAEIDERIMNNRGLLDREREIRAAATELRQLEAELETAGADERTSQAAWLAAERVYHDAHLQKQHTAAAVTRLRTSQERAGWLTGVPCHGEGPYAACRFLVDAVAARDTVREIATATEEADRDALARLTAADQARAEAHERTQSARTRLGELTSRTTVIQPLAQRLALLEAAQARVQELAHERQRLETQADLDRAAAHQAHDEAVEAGLVAVAQHHETINTARQHATDEQNDLTRRADVKFTAIATAEAAIARDLTALDQTIESLAALRDQHAGAKVALEQAETGLVSARAHDVGARQTLTRLEADIAAFEDQRARFQEELAQRLALDAEATRLETEQIEWTVLAKALGRDGLPTLEIDAAGPGVTALANDLLQACFGARFSVQIVTQVPTVDGKGVKEVFEVQVFDGERGGETKDLRLLSGGEAVIVDEAIKSSIALYNNQQNIFPIRTCFRDETIGALDPENALRYVAMLRRIRERGGFSRVLFVSHNLDAARLADAQLHVHDGRIDVVYPPFAGAEAA